MGEENFIIFQINGIFTLNVQLSPALKTSDQGINEIMAL